MRKDNIATLPSERLLVDRREAARLLCCSRDTIIRLEQAGKLKPRRLTGSSPQSCVYYRYDELQALAHGN